MGEVLNQSPPSYLLKGDLSGIQEFIFNVQSKGAAKTLKAKSYYVEVLGILCAKYCRKKLQEVGCEVEVICDSGGNFFFEITGKIEIDSVVKEMQQKIDDSLLHDEIAITISYVPKHSFGEAWQNLLALSNKMKLKRFKGNTQLFEPFFQDERGKELDNLKFPSYLQQHDEIKDSLSLNNLYKAILKRMVKSNFISVFQFDEEHLEKSFNDRLVNKLPMWSHYSEIAEYGKYRAYYGDTPVKENEEDDDAMISPNFLTDFDGFGDFAAHRTGTNKLGILTMDVDNLGEIFGKNCESPKCLSKRMVAFFDEKLHEIWANGTYNKDADYKPNIYPVFVGGDDCFIVGAWDAILYFAKAINDAFKETFKTEGYTLSAGIIIVDPKHPVVSFTELAKEALKKAKRDKIYSETLAEKNGKNEKHKKNAICLFNEVMSWDEYDILLRIVDAVHPIVDKKLVARSFLEKVKNSAKGFSALQQKILRESKIDMPQLWRLKYYLGKKSGDKEFEKVEQEIIKPYSDALQSALVKRVSTNPAIFPIAARIIDFKTRIPLSYDIKDKK